MSGTLPEPATLTEEELLTLFTRETKQRVPPLSRDPAHPLDPKLLVPSPRVSCLTSDAHTTHTRASVARLILGLQGAGPPLRRHNPARNPKLPKISKQRVRPLEITTSSQPISSSARQARPPHSPPHPSPPPPSSLSPPCRSRPLTPPSSSQEERARQTTRSSTQPDPSSARQARPPHPHPRPHPPPHPPPPSPHSSTIPIVAPAQI